MQPFPLVHTTQLYIFFYNQDEHMTQAVVTKALNL